MESICADWHSKMLVALCSDFVTKLWSLGPESRNRRRLDITDMPGLRSRALDAQNSDDPELFPPGFHNIKGFLIAYKNPSLEISAVFPFALPPNLASAALQNFLTMDSALDHSVRRELKALQGMEIFPHSFHNQDSAPISLGLISSEIHDGQVDLGIRRAHGGHSTNDDIPLSFDSANIFANNNTLELGSQSLLNNGGISFANFLVVDPSLEPSAKDISFINGSSGDVHSDTIEYLLQCAKGILSLDKNRTLSLQNYGKLPSVQRCVFSLTIKNRQWQDRNGDRLLFLQPAPVLPSYEFTRSLIDRVFPFSLDCKYH